MIKLINGRGQLGDLLKKEIDQVDTNKNVYIYHTWNIEDKSESAQRDCYNLFVKFVEERKDDRIVFISTASTTEDNYVLHKQLAEAYLISNVEDCLIIRLPTLIGKGVIQKFKQGELNPFGSMRLASLETSCKYIIKLINYPGPLKIKTLEAPSVPASLVKEICIG